jgi:hypothetical protein
MAKFYYRCRSCGEDFGSPVRETSCTECQCRYCWGEEEGIDD